MKRNGLFLGLIFVLLASCSTGSDSGSFINPVTPDSGSQTSNLDKYWYKNTSFYHIWVKSFATGSGVNSTTKSGTFNGIKANLDYIKDEVGCDGIWLSPIFDCAGKGDAQTSNMHGYDTTNFEAVNPKFGTEQNLADLITACHSKGIKIIFDFVPNHTSDAYEWFLKSCAGDEKYKDWYVWSDSGNSLNPCGVNTSNNRGGTGDKNPCAAGGAWFYKPSRGKYYYGAFGDGMPDLNYNNPEVQEYMLGIAKKWLDFGFDGIRVDACQYLVETNSQAAGTAGTHAFFARLRELLETYTESPKFMIGETWVEGSRSTLDDYFGSSAKPEFNMVFDFDAGRPILSSIQNQKDDTGDTLRGNPDAFEGMGYGTFLANHDVYEDRIGTEFDGDMYSIKQATALSLMRPTVPFIYYGQEIGMKAPNGGFVATNYSDMEMRYCFDWSAANAQKTQTNSVLKLNKALNAVRKAYPKTFAGGKITKLSSNDSKVLAYTISSSDAKLLCVYNLSEKAISSVTVSGATVVAGEASTLIGDTAASAASSFAGGSAVIKGLAPYSYRVYLMGDSSANNYFDDETYEAGGEHIASKIYLRGLSSDGWTWDPGEEQVMTRSVENNCNIWKQQFTCSQAGDKEFKLSASNSDWTKAWGGVTGKKIAVGTEFIAVTSTDSKNIVVDIPSDGTYTVIFNQTLGTVKVVSSSYAEPTNAVYLRGIPSWDSYKCIKVPQTSSGVYSVVMAPGSAGTYSFKFSKNPDNWNGGDWGSGIDSELSVSLGTETSIGSGGGNLKVNLTAGTSYKFVLNTTTNKLTVTGN